MISIIIPTYNEADRIAQTITSVYKLRDSTEVEVIIVDGGSTDKTITIAKESGATAILSAVKGRSAQMNRGASVAKGDILYFLHADCIPPYHFTKHIIDAQRKGIDGGCFRLAFDHTHWFLKANAWFTRFNINAFRFGDQSLFVTKNVFIKCGGFKEDLIIMEDQEIIHRIKKYGKFTVMNVLITTSARKYIDNGVFRMQVIFFRIWLLYYLGFSQNYLIKLHKRLIRKKTLIYET